jgi:hypothetical protein
MPAGYVGAVCKVCRYCPTRWWKEPLPNGDEAANRERKAWVKPTDDVGWCESDCVVRQSVSRLLS